MTSYKKTINKNIGMFIVFSRRILTTAPTMCLLSKKRRGGPRRRPTVFSGASRSTGGRKFLIRIARPRPSGLCPDVNRRSLQRDLKAMIEKGVVVEKATSPTDPTKHYVLMESTPE
jgi:hypothetical protein